MIQAVFKRSSIQILLIILMSFLLASCGILWDNDDDSIPITYTVGGSVNSLSGTLVLQNNGANNLAITADGPFTFIAGLEDGAAYSVTVSSQPAGQTCTVTDGSGTINAANVTSVQVTCTNNPAYSVGGSVNGLSGTLVLQNNGVDNLTRTADGDFTFNTAVEDGKDYSVTVSSQPTGQTCTVTNGAGTINGADVANTQVACVTNTYKVGGTVNGLSGTLVLQNNSSDDLTITADGDFTFNNALTDGAPYSVTVSTQPAGQTCTVTDGSGTISAANVTSVQVACVDDVTGVPAAPTGLFAMAYDSEVILFWSETSGATSYTVYWNTTGSVTTSDNKEVRSTAEFTHTGLTNGTTYYYRVSASNASGEGQLSAEEASAMPVAPPTGLKVTVVGTDITLSWNAASGATGYRVNWYTDGAPSTVVDVGSNTGETITAVTNNTTYYFRVAAYNSNGDEAQSGEASIKIADWKWANPFPNGNAIKGFAWRDNPSLFVAAGDGGAIYTSTDGLSWLIKNSSTVENLSGVASDGSQFVAVGERGTILLSPDGADWSVEPEVSWATLNDVAWNGTYFVAVGVGGTILTSPDALTWTEQISNFPGSLSRIKWLNSQFVAVGGTSGVILTSPDGEVWTSRSCAISREIEDLAWVGNKYVVIAGGGNICTSSDGATWVAETTTVSTTYSALTSDGSQFVLVGQNGQVHTSPDGSIWTRKYPTPSGFSKNLLAILWNGSQYVTGGYAGTILSGFDMTNWTLQSPDNATLLTLYDVVSGGTQFVAVGGELYDGIIVTSPDGEVWTESYTVSARLEGIAWNGTDQFVAVGSNDTILTSPDGETWTDQTSGTSSKYLSEAIWAGDKYVVVGDDVILTSTNGTSWTPAIIDDISTVDDITSVAWNGSRFVAVGSDYSPLQGFVWTSTDGSNWTKSDQSFGRLDDVTWGNGKFVATGAIGYTYTSDDGLTWTSNSIGTTGYMLFIEWDGSQFVGGVVDYLYTSPDGVTWTPQYTVLEGFSLHSITWNDLNKAVTVGYNGAIFYNDFW